MQEQQPIKSDSKYIEAYGNTASQLTLRHLSKTIQ